MPLPRMADVLIQLRAAAKEHGDDAPVPKVMLIGPDADPGYDATAPIPVGAAHTALVIKVTEHGLDLSLAAKEQGVDDLQRTILKSMYGKRARVIRETRTFPGASTDQLTENPNDDE